MYFGERNYSFGRKPDPEKNQLAEQNALLKKLLQQQAESMTQRRRRISLPFRNPTPTLAPLVAKEPPKTEPKSSRSKRLALWSGTVLLVALLAGGTLIFFMNRGSGPLPADVTKKAGFTLYYPSPMVPGYILKNGSAKLNGGSVLYTLQNGSKVISISEQAAPVNPPDLTQLPGFTKMQTPTGHAVIGTNAGTPVGVALNSTTLIFVNGHTGTPTAVVRTIVKNLNPLP